MPLFPLLGILLSLFLSTVGLDWFTWTRFLVWLLVGLIVYFLYGYHNSRPDVINAEPPLPESLSLE
ncbi:MAG: hypothetical protein M3160_06050 [Candidatus Eremiobacteraeota bacterium]|nr:hypothetical protein [Candidatus Eremiobacteraeota bacterium]